MIKRTATFLLLTTLLALPALAMTGEICHIESGMGCCAGESECTMPMEGASVGTADGCFELCACTFERRQSPIASPPENRNTGANSTAAIMVPDHFGTHRERHLLHIRPPLIGDRGDTYLQINCFRI